MKSRPCETPLSQWPCAYRSCPLHSELAEAGEYEFPKDKTSTGPLGITVTWRGDARLKDIT